MKIKLLHIITFWVLCSLSYGQTDSFRYLELSNDQLKDIGFVINKQGIFFRTEKPQDILSRDLYITIGYFNNKYRCSWVSTLAKIEGGVVADSARTLLPDSMNFCGVLPLKVDYYLVKNEGDNTAGLLPEYKTEKVLPVMIRQSAYNFSNKKDQILYLKATKSLKAKLSSVRDLERYVIKIEK